MMADDMRERRIETDGYDVEKLGFQEEKMKYQKGNTGAWNGTLCTLKGS